MLYNFKCNIQFNNILCRNMLVMWLMSYLSYAITFNFESTYEGYYTLVCEMNFPDAETRDIVFDYVCEYVTLNAAYVVVPYQISRHTHGHDEGAACTDLETVGGGADE